MNKKVICLSIIFILTATITAADETDHVMIVHNSYDHGEVSIENIEVREGHPPTFRDNSGNYFIRAADVTGQTLESVKFNFDRNPEEYHAPHPDMEKDLLEEVEESVRFEYDENIAIVSLYDQDFNKLDEYELEIDEADIENVDERSEAGEVDTLFYYLAAPVFLLMLLTLLFWTVKRRRASKFNNELEVSDYKMS